MINPNQRIVGPFGDIFTPNTSATDKLSAQLYAEQKAKEAQDAKDAKELDDEFAKNMANIRDADVGDLSKAYGNYKMASQRLYKNPNATPQDQMDVLKKKADLYSIIARSKKEKADEETAGKDLIKNPNNFLEGANNFLMERRNTPLSNFKQQGIDKATGKPFTKDMSDIYGNILDNGYGTDFNPVLTKAIGTKALRGVPVKTKTDDGLQEVATTYKGINSPTQIIMGLHDAITGDRKSKHFITQHSFTDDEANNIITEYNKLKETPEFKATYPNEPEISPSMLLTPLGKAEALYVMQQHVLNPPTPNEKTTTNLGALMDRKNKEKLALEDIKYKHSMNKIALMNQGKQYEIEDVAGKLRKAAAVVPTLDGGANVVDVTNWSDDELGDVLGNKKDRYGNRIIKPIEVGGKKYLKVTPDGFEVNGEDGKPLVVGDRDILNNTFKRTHLSQKDLGTNKARVKPVVDSELPIGTILVGADGTKIKTNKKISKSEAEKAGYKLQ